MLGHRLVREKENRIKGGLYHKIQIELAFNSNHIEGSQLTYDQTRYIYETNTIGFEENSTIKVDDIIETTNHFTAVDFLLDSFQDDLNETWIKEIHAILKRGTSDSRKSWFQVGDYKSYPNEVGGRETTLPEYVESDIQELLRNYHALSPTSFEDILAFHVRFECIYPFQDGNGRVGRLILFKECLKHGHVPFIIGDDMKYFYYRGLAEWGEQNGFLLDTCLAAQDRFKQYLEYFRIED
ncbi:TPA: Fic family protein [Streptococcus suis]|uniref:Cps29F n=1 Tax=Streptococcus suis TaxID=1307 RepID=M1VPA0_STRSU|nr:Fic family protein [Streptococcus suis]AGS58386.1 Cps29F [Streptococcus suis]NQQ29033.1 Fic family protein [Streptococcus suis]BAM95017.1 Fic/DOC family protein [Streptococcus suis]HEM3164464.1 Fic family protein [Streptococcus suis 92-1191]HEM5553047.1 Fic family protein [Streptococcus suis]